MLDASEAISYLVGTSGNAKLAADRASREKGVEISDAQLLLAVSSDPTATVALATQARVLILLRTLDTLRVTEMAYLESLENLSPAATAKAYTELLKTIGGMIAPAQQQSQNNTLAAVLSGLPPQVRESVQFLLTVGGDTDQIQEGASPPTQGPVKTPDEVTTEPAPLGYIYEEARVEAQRESFPDETLAQEREHAA